MKSDARTHLGKKTRADRQEIGLKENENRELECTTSRSRRAGKTTASTGTWRQSECASSCPLGKYGLTSACKNCPAGYFTDAAADYHGGTDYFQGLGRIPLKFDLDC